MGCLLDKIWRQARAFIDQLDQSLEEEESSVDWKLHFLVQRLCESLHLLLLRLLLVNDVLIE